MQGKSAVIVTPHVYDSHNKTFVHKYRDDEGNNQSVRLMSPAQLLAFYHDVLKLEDAQILELTAEGLEYPQDFASFDFESIEATIKNM